VRGRTPSPQRPGTDPQRPGKWISCRVLLFLRYCTDHVLSITQCSLADDALLRTYLGDVHPERWAGQGDCFCVTVPAAVPLSDFVFAFYTSHVFRIERWILAVVAGARSTDAEARAVADGSGDSFAVWRLGARTETQLVMGDRYGRTRSWFRVVPVRDGGTLLQFGSAVAVRREGPVARPSLMFRLLLRFHVIYSQVLLWAARRGVMNTRADV
jgi:hypothetical protein